jgi:hypothetical protein
MMKCANRAIGLPALKEGDVSGESLSQMGEGGPKGRVRGEGKLLLHLTRRFAANTHL